MRIQNPRNMNNEQLLSKIYVDNNSFIGNGSEDNALQLANGYDKYYTAFEVCPHKVDFTAGTNEYLNTTLTTNVAANTLHRMIIRTETTLANYQDSDIVVEWGDGDYSIIKNGDFVQSGTIASKNNTFTLEHDYVNALTTEGVDAKIYTIKVYGKNYYSISHRWSSEINDVVYSSNLMCRVFSDDLPIASHLYNLACFCAHAYLLTEVGLWGFGYRYFDNIQYLFLRCDNLITAVGFGSNFRKANAYNLFHRCINLETCDYQLAFDSHSETSSRDAFSYCYKLNVNVASLIPSVIQGNGPYKITKTFYLCESLTGTVPADKLWNNKKITFSDTTDCFTGCSDEIRAQVPVSWGGTASDDIIEKSLEDNIINLNSEYDALDKRLVTLEDADLVNRLIALEDAAARLANV